MARQRGGSETGPVRNRCHRHRPQEYRAPRPEFLLVGAHPWLTPDDIAQYPARTRRHAAREVTGHGSVARTSRTGRRSSPHPRGVRPRSGSASSISTPTAPCCPTSSARRSSPLKPSHGSGGDSCSWRRYGLWSPPGSSLGDWPVARGYALSTWCFLLGSAASGAARSIGALAPILFTALVPPSAFRVEHSTTSVHGTPQSASIAAAEADVVLSVCLAPSRRCWLVDDGYAMIAAIRPISGASYSPPAPEAGAGRPVCSGQRPPFSQ